MKKTYKIEGMHCNSCAMLIEEELKEKVNRISVSHPEGQAEIDFDEKKISEKDIKNTITKMGYKIK